MVAHNETRCESPLHKRGVYNKKLIKKSGARSYGSSLPIKKLIKKMRI